MSVFEEQLKTLLGSKAAMKTLMFLSKNQMGHLRLICRETGLFPMEIKNQLRKFQTAGILAVKKDDQALIYYWNPKSKLAQELQRMLKRNI
jgi:hypothetical protein